MIVSPIAGQRFEDAAADGRAWQRRCYLWSLRGQDQARNGNWNRLLDAITASRFRCLPGSRPRRFPLAATGGPDRPAYCVLGLMPRGRGFSVATIAAPSPRKNATGLFENV